jgi:hypothetical protein
MTANCSGGVRKPVISGRLPRWWRVTSILVRAIAQRRTRGRPRGGGLSQAIFHLLLRKGRALSAVADLTRQFHRVACVMANEEGEL